jgi:hypothetical protein
VLRPFAMREPQSVASPGLSTTPQHNKLIISAGYCPNMD